ncbi:MAG: glycosyltransferase family 4 protein [Salinibacter sp.]|uniref:glycosyltransferase family 4 protein n=1 Tax=Salinibacter sp. TaxID=2065818 RepID=UPI0035D4BA48
MRIGHYDARLWAQGGIASYVRRVGQAQARTGHDVVFLCRASEGDAPSNTLEVENDRALFSAAQARGLDVLHLHGPVETLPEDRVPTVRTVHTNDASCPSGSRYLKRTGQPCDRDYSVAGCLWGHLVDHCGSRRPHNTWANFQRIQQEQTQAAALPTITVSRFLKEQMIRSGCPAETLRVLHSPAPTLSGTFSPPPRRTPPHFVFAGRIEPQKGLDWLLRSLGAVDADVHLDVAGTGDEGYLDTLDQLVADLGIREQVTFHGWLDEDAVYALIEQARGVVVPSVWHEPAGLVTLEAAALGRPVVASEVGGIPEYATDAFALRVPPRDTEALAGAITTLARDPDRATAMGRRGHDQARSEFAMDRFLRRLDAFYDDVRSSTQQPVSS